MGANEAADFEAPAELDQLIGLEQVMLTQTMLHGLDAPWVEPRPVNGQVFCGARLHVSSGPEPSGDVTYQRRLLLGEADNLPPDFPAEARREAVCS